MMRWTIRFAMMCLAPVMAVVLSGCGKPTLDTTTEATSKASMQKMTEGMTPEQKKQFAGDMIAATFPDAMKSAFSNIGKAQAKPPAPTGPNEMLKPLHGMTVEQIHAKAEAARIELKAKKKS